MNKITILMSCYNCENSLDKAINSILEQTFQDWILYLCDDGSIDGTKIKLEWYQKKYPDKIKCFYNAGNKGLTYSLNRMLDDVNTKYFARMDSDDIAINTRLEKQFLFLENNPEYDLCGSWVNKFDEKGIYGITKYKEKPSKEDLYWNSPFAHPSLLIKTDIVKKVGGYRDIKKTIRCEDYDLWFRLYADNNKGYNIQEPLLNYYEGRESYSKRKFRYRINEARVRFEGYKNLKMFPKGFIYVMKPLVLGLLPSKTIIKFKRRFYD